MCRKLFKILKILPLCSQNIFPLLLFVVKNRNLILSNSEIHTTNTRHNRNHIIHLVTCLPKGNLLLWNVTLELKSLTSS
jgi:hypothetical protein